MYAIVDIETTGSYASANGITEIAICIHDGKKVVKRFQSLVNPHKEIPVYISALTGITNEMVQQAPPFEDVAADVYHLIHGKIFVAHNVNSGSRFKVIEAFATQHTPLNITLELDTIETIKRFVQKRVGLGFVPRMCVRDELERGALVSVPVRGLTHNRTLWAAHRRGTHFSPAAAAFLAVLRKRVATST